MARHARTLDAGQLAVLDKRILAYLDQDGARPKDTTEARRRLSFHDRDGGYELAGWLDREAAEILRSALSPLAAPRPTTDTEVDLGASPWVRLLRSRAHAESTAREPAVHRWMSAANTRMRSIPADSSPARDQRGLPAGQVDQRCIQLLGACRAMDSRMERSASSAPGVVSFEDGSTMFGSRVGNHLRNDSTVAELAASVVWLKPPRRRGRSSPPARPGSRRGSPSGWGGTVRRTLARSDR